MSLQAHEIQPEDRKHLHCTDPRVADEVDAVNRSLKRLNEEIVQLSPLDPTVVSGKEVN